MDKQLTLTEFADRLRLSTRTIRRYIKAGLVKPTIGGKRGQRYRIPESQIKAILKEAGK